MLLLKRYVQAVLLRRFLLIAAAGTGFCEAALFQA